ncbi:Uncharacterised protein [Mycobacterium tuberculosis]|nr:Uncharacterised protein [Mycobacterium tuberculosis]
MLTFVLMLATPWCVVGLVAAPAGSVGVSSP